MSQRFSGIFRKQSLTRVVLLVISLISLTSIFGIAQAESVRQLFARVYCKPDGVKLLEKYANNPVNRDAMGEIVSLLYSFPVPFSKQPLGDRIFDKWIDTGKGLLARATFRFDIPQSIQLYKQYAVEVPLDFLPYCRIAYLTSITEGGSSSVVEGAILRVEQLTENHPVHLKLRGHQFRNATGTSLDYLENVKKSYTYFKLFEYAVQLVDKKYVDTIYLAEIWTYLKKKGITPPEPTPEQYAAVKKRGWAFNKQMLEPFKKVD